MSEQPTSNQQMLAPQTPAPETERPVGKGRKWLAGTALVAAGVVAGSGMTYAITTVSNPTQTQFSQGGPGNGPRGGGMPNGADGNGQPPGGQPTTGSS